MLRVIPRLDIKGKNLIKPISFEGLRVLGAPEDFARKYYEGGADELLFMDTVASLYCLALVLSRKGWRISPWPGSIRKYPGM